MSADIPPETRNEPTPRLAAALNRNCHCITVDTAALRRRLEEDLGDSRAGEELARTRPGWFAASPVFVTRPDVDRMAEIITAVERVVSSPVYRKEVLGESPEIARRDPGTSGVFFGYDFHLSTSGPRLIEINTNAGGTLLNVPLARAQRACCAEVEKLVVGSVDLAALEKEIVDMFRAEWRRRSPDGPLRTVAIVDEKPEDQFLYPEFLLFQRLFERHGIRAHITDPRELRLRDGRVALGDLPIDLVYNRLTDFYLEEPGQAVLRDAYRIGSTVVTPHPHAHALYANKGNLARLSDPKRLEGYGVGTDVTRTLVAGIPRTVLVTRENADALWSARRSLFFKPLAGYGSRGAYRGDKITKRVWRSILGDRYVAQETIPPTERALLVDGSSRTMKIDVRCTVYAQRILLLSARTYRGQTTNLRTEGGGLTTVFTTPS